MTLKRIDTNPIVESVARKNKKFRKYLELKKKGKIIRNQPKLPGMKKGKSVTIKPVGMVFKVEKKLAGGLLGTAIRGAVRSEPGKNLFKGLKSKLKEMYAKGNEKRSEADKKMLKGLFKVDLKRTKTDILQDMMKFLYKAGRGAPKGTGPRLGAAEGLRSYRKLRAYKKNINKQGQAIIEKKAKNVKLNSKGGMQKFNTGGMADYYKDIL
tara:strand:+ start:270 stop:899 length:630 start_codon:yes stop_codon:yes gene_type:complete